MALSDFASYRIGRVVVPTVLVTLWWTTISRRPLPAQAPAARSEIAASSHAADYARACLRLARAEMAAATEQDRRAPGTISPYDLQRLTWHVRFAEQNLSYAHQGADESQVLAGYLELRARLAELDLRAAETLHDANPSTITPAQLERARSYAEVCRTRLAMAQDPLSPSQQLEHVHWVVQRLSEEVVLLNERVEALEQTARQ